MPQPAPTEPAAQLQWLVDRAEITDLIYAYGRTIDTRDWSGWADLYAPGATCDGAMTGLRREQFAEQLAALLTFYPVTQHMLSNVTVSVDGDTAHAHAYVQAVHVADPAAMGNHTDLGGWYDCDLVRTEAGWRLGHRALEMVWSSGEPFASGVTDDRTAERYIPSSWDWVREQVEAFESSNGTAANTRADTDEPIIVITNRGAKTGAIRKTPLMRIEKDGKYLAVGSKGGRKENPGWVYNFRAYPEVELQDGPVKKKYLARELSGDERAEWWDYAVQEWGNYAQYQEMTARLLPVFLLEPVEDGGQGDS